MGGLDIFKARMNDSGLWQIENMKAPINSQADDFGITFGEEESGFFHRTAETDADMTTYTVSSFRR